MFVFVEALTLTLRWFGLFRGRDGARRRAADRGGGTLTGVMALAASAAYDYHLQAEQLAGRHAAVTCA